MTDNDLTRLDAWLAHQSDVFHQAKAELAPEKEQAEAPIVSRTNECIHCGDEGCKHCEGDFEPDYEDEYDMRAAEASYESYLGRS